MRHQLEHRAVAGAQAEHGDHEQSERHGRAGNVEADRGDADGCHGIHHQQAANAADAVGEGTTQRAHQAAGEHAGGGVVAGDHRLQAVLVVEVAGQGAGQAEEAAESDAVEEHEPPAVAVAERLHVVGEGFRRGALGGVPGGEGEDHQGQHQRDQRQAEHVVPAEQGGQAGREEGGEHGAGVAGAGDAHGLALVLRRIPLRGQRQGDGEGRAGDAEEQAEQQCLLVAVDAQLPGGEQGGDDDDLAEQAGELRRGAVGQQAHEEAQHGAGEDRRGDHHRALLGAQPEVGGDLHAERAEHVPDHETQVEIEKRGKQGWGMPGLPETCIHLTPHPVVGPGGCASP
ncbi:hypothetical protein D9M69_406830 [compost metagenome]